MAGIKEQNQFAGSLQDHPWVNPSYLQQNIIKQNNGILSNLTSVKTPHQILENRGHGQGFIHSKTYRHTHKHTGTVEDTIPTSISFSIIRLSISDSLAPQAHQFPRLATLSKAPNKIHRLRKHTP